MNKNVKEMKRYPEQLLHIGLSEMIMQSLTSTPPEVQASTNKNEKISIEFECFQ